MIWLVLRRRFRGQCGPKWRACELSDRGGGAPTPRCCGRVVREEKVAPVLQGPGDDRFYVVRSHARARRARETTRRSLENTCGPPSSQVKSLHFSQPLHPEPGFHMPFPTDERSRGLGVHRPVTESLEPADFNPPETFAWGRSVRRPPPPALLSAVSCAAIISHHHIYI